MTVTYWEESYPPSVYAGAIPAITTLSPATAISGATGVPIQVNGSKFSPYSVVYISGVAVATTFVSTSQLRVTYVPATTGTKPFRVVDTDGSSNTVNFTVTATGEEEPQSEPAPEPPPTEEPPPEEPPSEPPS